MLISLISERKKISYFEEKTSSKRISNSKRELRIDGAKRFFFLVNKITFWGEILMGILFGILFGILLEIILGILSDLNFCAGGGLWVCRCCMVRRNLT